MNPPKSTPHWSLRTRLGFVALLALLLGRARWTRRGC